MILPFAATKNLLEKYRLPLAKTILIKDKQELFVAAKEIGFPLVLKVSSTDVLHRTEKGLLRTGVQNQTEAEKAFADLNDKDFEGILVQEQLKGLELFCGLKKDKVFGPVLMFGLGGIFVEALKDVAFGICPLSLKEAKEMISSLKGKDVLKGFRGMPSVDLNVLADILVKISLLAIKEDFKTIDFNPLIAQGKDIKIVDIKINI